MLLGVLIFSYQYSVVSSRLLKKLLHKDSQSRHC